MNDNAFDRPVGRRVRDEVAKAQWRLGPARERVVRVGKRLRNLIVDPPPRSQELVYEATISRTRTSRIAFGSAGRPSSPRRLRKSHQGSFLASW